MYSFVSSSRRLSVSAVDFFPDLINKFNFKDLISELRTALMPRLPRFFITPEQVTDPHIIISGEDVRHISTVLRMKPGDQLSLCNGKGAEYTVRIIDAGRTEVRTEIVSRSTQEIHSPLITLGQGLPKSDKMDLIMQKATELGVSSIIPIVTERTILKVKDEEKRVARWQKICREAAMQSSRPDIPLVGNIQTFGRYLSALIPDPGTLYLFPWEEASMPVRTVLRSMPDAKHVVVLIGPEGGFSASEAESAKQKGFHPVSLGTNILRTETAAIAVLSMIRYEFVK